MQKSSGEDIKVSYEVKIALPLAEPIYSNNNVRCERQSMTAVQRMLPGWKTVPIAIPRLKYKCSPEVCARVLRMFMCTYTIYI